MSRSLSWTKRTLTCGAKNVARPLSFYSVTIAEALVAISAGEIATAIDVLDRVRQAQPDDLLARSLAEFLERARSTEIYDEPTAFEEFISNGDNPNLYSRTVALLEAIHRANQPASVLDIGCGDGRITAAVLGSSTSQVDLVEPSTELLASSAELVAGIGRSAAGHDLDIATYLDRLAPSTSWDLVQSTFALHNLTPAARLAVFGQLAGRAKRLVIVEFDVPGFEDGSVEHARYAAERYAVGVEEYRDRPDVISGFLMPVLVGQFDPNRHRSTFETAIEAWMAQLEESGWKVTNEIRVADYWWAPAVCIEAEPRHAGGRRPSRGRVRLADRDFENCAVAEHP